MSRPFWPRLGRTLAFGAAVVTAHSAVAQEPAAIPATYATPAPPKFVDVYHGTTKVGVMMVGRPPAQRVLPTAGSAVARPSITETRTEVRTETHVPDEMLAALRAAENNQRATAATADLLARLEERLKVSAEPRTIFPVTYTFPVTPPPSAFMPPYPQTAPWLIPAPPAQQLVPIPATPAPAAAPVQQQPPQIVVIRESGEPRPMMMAAPMPAPEARGITLSTETLLGLGVGVVGLGFGFAAYLRSGRVQAAALKPPAPPSQMAPDGVMLMGKYNAGPRSVSAEKFELGPSYQHLQEEKKKVEAEGEQAVLEFILSQNLALHAEIAGPEVVEPELAGPDLAVDAGGQPTEPAAPAPAPVNEYDRIMLD